MGGYGLGPGMMGGFGLLGTMFYILILINLALLAFWLWKQINKK